MPAPGAPLGQLRAPRSCSNLNGVVLSAPSLLWVRGVWCWPKPYQKVWMFMLGQNLGKSGFASCSYPTYAAGSPNDACKILMPPSLKVLCMTPKDI